MENTISSDICRKCAECCKHYPFVELSQNEICALEELTGLSPDAFTNPKDEGAEEYFLKFKENGDCFFLIQNSGGYSCGAYEARSKICRNYPSNPSQDEVCDANIEIILLNSAR